MIQYSFEIQNIKPVMLSGFFVGWPNPPDREPFLKILKGSSHVVLAIDNDADYRVVGFINAISDGVLAAYLPLLEVLPEYQGRGIGGELMRLILKQLDGFYMIDLACDEDLVPFYKRFGLNPMRTMSLRNFEHQAGQ